MHSISNSVKDLFEIFEENATVGGDETLISAHGLTELVRSLGLVPIKNKDAVWEGFLILLYKADYVQNIEMKE